MKRLIFSKQCSIVPTVSIISVILLCIIFINYYFTLFTLQHIPLHWKSNSSTLDYNLIPTYRFPNGPTATSRTLIVYVFGETHAKAEQNLAFFIRNAVHQSHNADYYFILQQINDRFFDKNKLPKLPSNAHYIQHENKCFDIGTIGWFLSSGMIDKSKYKYFIFLNSSVRGPFIVSYYDSPIWYTIFTRRLNDHIKLVGCTINCEPAPHVQSYLWALNPDTFDFLLKNTSVFACHATKDDTISNAEIVASRAILKLGYGIDSLMTKYQGVDFRFNVDKQCADRLNPTINKGVNGITLDPYEVVFVKTKFAATKHDDNFERLRIYENWKH